MKKVVCYIIILICLKEIIYTDKVFASSYEININNFDIHQKQTAVLPTTIPTLTSAPVAIITPTFTPPIVRNIAIPEYKTTSSSSLYISPDFLSFDQLSPSNPLLRSSLLSVNGSQSTVYIYSTSVPTDEHGDTIEPTTCDDGSCNENYSGLWDQTLTYGFGYRCDALQGIVCNTQFINVSFYNQIPLFESTAFPAYYTLQQNVVEEHKAKLTFKVNVPPTQNPGLYTTTVTYSVLPNL